MSIELHKQMSIPELISAVRMTMLRLRYSSATLCIYDCIWKDFTEYCNRQNIAVFDETIGNRFAITLLIAPSRLHPNRRNLRSKIFSTFLTSWHTAMLISTANILTIRRF